MLRLCAVLPLLLAVRPAKAEPQHAVSLEIGGKGGLWGLGYDVTLREHFVAGAVGSFYLLAGDRYYSFSPYVGAYPVRGTHAGWFVQLGPQLLRHTTPSPVPEWDGMTTTSVVGEVSTGFEYRSRWIARVYAMLSVGDHTAPWLGASFGWTL